jgi:hypothetical protein
VPLDWLSSSTHAFFPDETNLTIRRTYTHPSHSRSKRHFCGFCGTPISYWTEEPASEAGFICVALGSLMRDDLVLLDVLGLVGDGGRDDTLGPPLASIVERRARKKQRTEEAEGAVEEAVEGGSGGGARKTVQKPHQQLLLERMADKQAEDAAVQPRDWAAEPLPAPVAQVEVVAPSGRPVGAPSPPLEVVSHGVPWLDALLAGSRLQRGGHLKKRTAGSYESPDGRARSQWEILEWAGSSSDGGDDDGDDESSGEGGGGDKGEGGEGREGGSRDDSKEPTPPGGKRKRSSGMYQATVEDAEE